MSDTSSKALATRVPLDEYVAILTDAVNMKISVSDYLLLAIKKFKEPQPEPQTKTVIKEKKVEVFKKDPKDAKTIEALQKQIRELEASRKELNNIIHQKGSELEKKIKEKSKLTDENKSLLSIIRKLKKDFPTTADKVGAFNV